MRACDGRRNCSCCVPHALSIVLERALLQFLIDEFGGLQGGGLGKDAGAIGADAGADECATVGGLAVVV